MPNDWPPRRSERLTGLIGGPRPGWRALGAPPRSAANGAAGEGEQVTPHEYMREIVAPTIEDLAATPSSRRHAFIACVVTFHALDYLAGTRRKAVLRAEYRRRLRPSPPSTASPTPPTGSRRAAGGRLSASMRRGLHRLRGGRRRDRRRPARRRPRARQRRCGVPRGPRFARTIPGRTSPSTTPIMSSSRSIETPKATFGPARRRRRSTPRRPSAGRARSPPNMPARSLSPAAAIP